MTKRFALIGAGPSGLAAARNLSKLGIDFDGFESAPDVGGLWNIDNPRSTVYESAHLISSRTTTQFSEFPMPPGTPDYPGHRQLRAYFSAFAERYGLRERFQFETAVVRVEPVAPGEVQDAGAGAASSDSGSDSPRWAVTTEQAGVLTTREYDGVILANGTLATPSIPKFEGEFTGEIVHTSAYKSPEIFRGKRVLIIGAGNSGCDIAVDAVHAAASVDMSVRRGYYFVPKYLFGRPSDTLNQGRPLPARIKQALDSRVLKLFTGDPVRFGFPKPDYKIYESHPIVNTLVLHHLGQGDLAIRPDIRRFDGSTVHFADGTSGDYDLITLATGYTLDYPFIDRAHLNWTGQSPTLFLNIFEPGFNGIYVLGMIEASGIGWQGRYEQAELLARYLAASPTAQASLRADAGGRWPDVTGGYHYLGLARMSYYVNKDAYRRAVKHQIAQLTAASHAPPVSGSAAPASAQQFRTSSPLSSHLPQLAPHPAKLRIITAQGAKQSYREARALARARRLAASAPSPSLSLSLSLSPSRVPTATIARRPALSSPTPEGAPMNIDEATLNFNPASLLTLDIVLAFIMFGIALAVKIDDFRGVLRMPKAMAVGIGAQFLLLPAITFVLTLILQVGPSISLGMILVACCPPGNISQVLTNQAKGNVALSVSMTAVGNLLAIFLMPINFAFWGNLHPTGSEIFKAVELDGFDMMLKIILIIGLPFVAGVLIGNRWPAITAKVQPWVRRISLLALVAFIVIALIGNWNYFMAFIGVVLLAVFLHDTVALALGYGVARAFGLDSFSTKAVTFEVGIRNAGLGLGLVFAFFGGLGGMAVVAGWWGIWDIIAGLVLATVWSRMHSRAARLTNEIPDAAPEVRP